MPYSLLFYDEFDNGTVDLLTDVGNGSISESGTRLNLSWLAGVNTDWWGGSVHNAPIAYERLSYFLKRKGLYYFETVLDSWSGSDHQFAGLTLFSDRNNAYRWIWTTYGPYHLFTCTIFSDSGSVNYESGNIGALGSITLRIYVNDHPYWYSIIDEDNFALAPNSIAFYGKIPGSTTWTRFYSKTLDFVPLYFGVHAGNGWSTTAVGAFGFNYLSLYEEKFDSLTLSGDKGSVEEKLSFGKLSFYYLTGNPLAARSEIEPKGSAEERLHWRTEKTLLSQVGSFPQSSDQGSIEELVHVIAGQTPELRPSASDIEGHPYFVGHSIISMAYYDTGQDPWFNPVGVTGFNGYGRDGYLYLAGVKQITQAPWRSESASNHRSSRSEFPRRFLVCTTQKELVIFDMDSWPTSVIVWMRFLLGDASNYYMVGRGDNSLRQAAFSNGLLAVATMTNSWEVGSLITIDFKSNNQYASNILRNTEHWRLISGKTIADRNSGGLHETFSSPYRLGSSNFTNVTVESSPLYLDGSATEHQVLAGGEDGLEILFVGGAAVVAGRITLSAAARLQNMGPDAVIDDSTRIPYLFLDQDRWLWWSLGSRIYRSVVDYRYSSASFLQGLGACRNYDPNLHPAYVDLSHFTQSWQMPPRWTGDRILVTCMCSLGDYIFAGTSHGVFRIHRVTLECRFSYSIAGRYAVGRNNIAGEGAIIAGDQPFISHLSSFQTTESDYLVVSCGNGAFLGSSSTKNPLSFAPVGQGSITIIRLYDDYPIIHIPPDLFEEGAWSGIALMGVPV